jgi:hypothetical protein
MLLFVAILTNLNIIILITPAEEYRTNKKVNEVSQRLNNRDGGNGGRKSEGVSGKFRTDSVTSISPNSENGKTTAPNASQ